MVDNSYVHKRIQSALTDCDVTRAVSMIGESDVDIDYRDVTHDLQTLLMKICYMDVDLNTMQPVLETMFEKDPDVNIQDSWGRTFLMHACISNKPFIIEALLGYEITDVTILDFDGNSALCYAVQNCDLYTIEDLLHHEDGPSLLTICNKKGQSPYSIAEKNGNKQILRVFDPYIQVEKSNELKQKKTKKFKPHDVIQLPPAYSSTPRDVANPRSKHYRKSDNKNRSHSDLRFEEDRKGRLKIAKFKYPVDTHRSNSDDDDAVVKCGSAPVMRDVWSDRTEFLTSLSLTSPRLTRRHHKQDCLLSENIPLNKSLPPMKQLQDSQRDSSGDLDIPECNMRRHRRPSISLPDLRNISGSLVSSGNSTPTSDGSRQYSKHMTSSNDFTPHEDDVFSQSFTNNKHRFSNQQTTLPEIHSGMTNMTLQSKNSLGISPLARQRKYSNSDDQLQRLHMIENQT